MTLEGYRERLRGFLDEEVRPNTTARRRDPAFPRAWFRDLGRLGLLRACLRPDGAEPGRLPLDLPTFAVLVEELATAGCPGFTLSVCMHVGVFTPFVAGLAHPRLRDAVLEAALSGEALGTVAATEAGVAGSDFAGMETSAAFTDDGIRVSGHKRYITSATEADWLVTFARHRPGREFASFSALLVPAAAPGVARQGIAMGVMREAAIGAVDLDDVELEPVHLLGRKGLGLRYFLQHIAVERLAGGIWAAALAGQELEGAQRHALRRVVGTTTLWERSAVRQRVARDVVRLVLLRHAVDALVAETERTGQVPTLTSAVVKVAAAEVVERTIGTCLQLRGAEGLEAESGLLGLYAEARAWAVGGGTTETMLDMVGDLWAAAR